MPGLGVQDWAGEAHHCGCGMSSRLHLHAGGPGAVLDSCSPDSNPQIQGRWEGAGCRAASPAHLQTCNRLLRRLRGPTDPEAILRLLRRNFPARSGSSFLKPASTCSPAFQLPPLSVFSHLCSRGSLPFQNPQLSFQWAWAGGRFHTQVQPSLLRHQGQAPHRILAGGPRLPFRQGPPGLSPS